MTVWDTLQSCLNYSDSLQKIQLLVLTLEQFLCHLFQNCQMYVFQLGKGTWQLTIIYYIYYYILMRPLNLS